MACFIQLQTSSVLHIPLHYYDQNFTFIINNEKFRVNRVIADLLSPKISRYRLSDPTIDEYSITTKSKGNFQTILNLLEFNKKEFTEAEIPFISEILNQLETSEISIEFKNSKELTQNSLDQIHKFLKFPNIFKSNLEKYIDDIAHNFFELKEEEMNSIEILPIDLIEKIISHPNLQLQTEDQLISFINKLYLKDSHYSFLYSYVIFKNISITSMKDFISIFNIDDITSESWRSLSNRLTYEITIKDEEPNEVNTKRYKESKQEQENSNMEITKEISYENQNFKGIINYLQKNSNIDDELKISYSSIGGNDPKNLIQYDKYSYFYTDNIQNSWICFEFKKHDIIPSDYTIRSYNRGSLDPKDWVIEGSKNNSDWEIIDQQNDCQNLKGNNLVHTFSIEKEKQKPFKYLRIRQTGLNWGNNNILKFDSIEFYGKLI